MVIVYGNTFEKRDRLSMMGGRWCADAKHWEFHGLCKEHRDELLSVPGIRIRENDATKYSEGIWQPPRPWRKGYVK